MPPHDHDDLSAHHSGDADAASTGPSTPATAPASHRYPFSAVVGADDPDGMGLALILTTISPAVGGVLIRGEKGTAKSTLVRALAGVLPPIDVVAGDRFSTDPTEPHPLSPDGPFPADAGTETRPVRLVELPVGATEDRVLGSLHLQRAITEGAAEYEPGLLARAHRGILYVDEVNLLHDHLVDLLLDAAAMGRSTVERDGVSIEHAARFVLVGTMNPEEGELRPQLLDRFGLTVEVAAPRDPDARAEVVRRRLAFEADPEGFCAQYADAEEQLSKRIRLAQERVGDVELGDRALTATAAVCAAFEVDGMRADIVVARAAVAHAAWQGRGAVARPDVRAAALLALPHRRRRNPFDAPGLDEELLDRVLAEVYGDEPDPPPPEEPDEPSSPTEDDEGGQQPDQGSGPEDPGASPAPQDADDGDHSPSNTGPDGSTESDEHDHTAEGETDPSDDAPEDESTGAPGTGGAPSQVVGTTQPYRPRLFTVSGTGAGEAGRRSRARTESGRRVGTKRADGPGGTLDLAGTVLAAAPHQRRRGRTDGPLRFAAEDLRMAVQEGKESNLILFCVDASGSMAARKRMQQVKTAILSLLLDAYQRRDKVGLVTFRGDGADVALPPTSSVEAAAARLEDLPAGGRTPLAAGLLQARHTLATERTRDPRRRPLLVVVTDGRATAGTGGPAAGADPVALSRQAAGLLAADGVPGLVLDCETGRMRLGLAQVLAGHLGAEHVPVGEVSAEALAEATRGGRAA